MLVLACIIKVEVIRSTLVRTRISPDYRCDNPSTTAAAVIENMNIYNDNEQDLRAFMSPVLYRVRFEFIM